MEEIQDHTTPESETGSDRSPEVNDLPVESPESELQQNTEETSKDIPPVPYEKFRETRQEVQKLKAELAQVKGTGTPAQAPSQDDLDADPESQKALDAIASVIDARMSPRLAVLEKLERREAIDDLGQRPYAGELAGEIVSEMKNLPESMPFSQRIDLAYKNAIAGNLDKIVKQSSESGYKEAYAKQAEKRSAQTVKAANPSRGEGTDFDISRFSEEEKRANWDQIVAKAAQKYKK